MLQAGPLVGRVRRRHARQRSNGAQNFPPIAEKNAEVFQVLIGQFGKNRKINTIFCKTFPVLGHAQLFKPVRNLLHRQPRAANRQRA